MYCFVLTNHESGVMYWIGAPPVPFFPALGTKFKHPCIVGCISPKLNEATVRGWLPVSPQPGAGH